MRLRSLRRNKSTHVPTRLALDIGTEYVKALVVTTGARPMLLGVGRARQGSGDMEDGAVARIAGVVECCRKAIDEAYGVAGQTPVEVVVGVAGEHVQGALTTIQMRRRRPNRPISPSEVARFLQQAQAQARTEAISALELRTGLAKIEVELLHTSVVEVKIDGHKVRNPVSFSGNYVEITLFYAFAPLVHIGTLRTVVNRLGLLLKVAVPESFAVAAGMARGALGREGAVIVDIGGGSTDIAVVRDGAVRSARSLPLGGRAFTNSIARHFGIDVDEAEALKLDFSMGVLNPTVARSVERVVSEDLRILRDALQFGLEELAGGGPLPPTLCLCGGGAALPGVQGLFSQRGWARGTFARKVRVLLLEPEDMQPLEDPDLHLSGLRDVTPKALGVRAALYSNTSQAPWDDAAVASD